MSEFAKSERGSAMVESAILAPLLILLVMISAAFTDVMILKLKAAEAVRYALWESTVFKPAAQIQDEVQKKFADLKSPRSLDTKGTGLLFYPLATDLGWEAAVDLSSTKAGLGGQRAELGSGFWSEALGAVSNTLGTSVDTVTRSQGFNAFGVATATVALTHARQSFGLTLLADLSFHAPLAEERPMQLVFDTWKAWPTPGAATNPASPMQTYPVVEEMVSAQVKKIAFSGLSGYSWFSRLNSIGGTLAGNGVSDALSGGKLPEIFSTERMDGPNAGPITILPVGIPQESWAPSQCDFNGSQQTCGTQRLGGLVTTEVQFLGDDDALGAQVDSTRYTVPFKLNSRYWTKAGGVNELSADTASLQPLPDTMASESAKSWSCRGHFFAGAQTAQQTDRGARYSKECP
jgi:hypothetical protein